MKNIFKKIFCKKGKPKEPLLTNDDKESVPIEKKDDDNSWGEVWTTNPAFKKEEPVAPTLERQCELENIIPVIEQMNISKAAGEKIKNKKDNRNPDDDRASWPGNKHFNL